MRVCRRYFQLSLKTWIAVLALMSVAISAEAPHQPPDYELGAGDSIRIHVYKHPDLGLETRISQNGTIIYPLVGSINLGGSTLAQAGVQIATGLRAGGYVKNPEVSVLLLEARGSQVAVLGQVNQPGRYPLETFNVRLSDVVAMAGGISSNGSELIVVTGQRNGQPFRAEVDFPTIFESGQEDRNILLRGGDIIFVDQAPTYYIYGAVQQPGVFRIARGMSLRQALARGGGVDAGGSEGGMRVYRKANEAGVQKLKLDPSELVQADDVIFIPESLF